MKVKVYNTTKYKNTTTYDVKKITAMPEPDEITKEDIDEANGVMLGLWLTDGRTIFIPHSFLIEVI